MVTFRQFLFEQERRDPGSGTDLTALLGHVAEECRTVARRLARRMAAGGPDGGARTFGRYLLVIEHPDHAPGAAAGSVFAVLRASEQDDQPGDAQVCAGYVLYGATTTLVLTRGAGVSGFTLDPDTGEFVSTHPHLRIPAKTTECIIDVAHRRRWEPAVRRYVEECLAGSAGPLSTDRTLNWTGSLVADVHRVLTTGAVFLAPRDSGNRAGTLCLRTAANPVAMLVEQAGGAASTGRTRVLGIEPEDRHQRTPLIIGPAHEVALIQRYHRDHVVDRFHAPLYGARTLYHTHA